MTSLLPADHRAPAAPTALREVLDHDGIRSVYQPLVELATGRLVGYEALARGPVGPLERPDHLFAAAREHGLLAELDAACRRSALRGAVGQGLVAPLTLFVNVEPEVLESAPLDDLVALAAQAPGRLRVVLEITERALTARPAELLQTVQRVRELGWGVALDDVGAESASLAFLEVVRPDVVKLDLRLVQQRPDRAVAEIMNAVNAYAERSGALLLAEGIETEQHRRAAEALGATLGQGWLFGRGTDHPAGPDAVDVAPLALATSADPVPPGPRVTPFDCLPAGTPLRRSTKRLLVQLSIQLEREARRLGDTCVVGATFQHARHFTPDTARRYAGLAAGTAFTCVLGEGLGDEPAPGLRGAPLAADDPVADEWDVTVLSPHFSAALLARDLRSGGPDGEREFNYALTYRRETVVAATRALLGRVAPRR
ncbi:EAL domain-containing protein [Microlunatus capsulatus]|uniref:EAL domain-containing protein (Putative c-di-GMP-specific phosphodiesterase class I) n=1 Tax=Microlunatus capsulatus TaxID=99117 RepID=A0ABS4Z5B6_9ACTN|nr:EAL domain-containing protein [Microlunatus capsulatus]MBP2416228.1 EAL domain-containing protein (putative c-di-GMP-specific phosphodiesterase class I) [Microlunatus capsulatus]